MNLVFHSETQLLSTKINPLSGLSKRHCRKATNTELSLCSISSASTDFKIKYCGNSDKKVWVGSINEDGCIKGKILSSCGNKESKECTYKVKEKEIACMKPFDLNERSNINDDFLQRSLGWSDNKNHDFSWSNKNSEWVSKNHKCNNK